MGPLSDAEQVHRPAEEADAAQRFLLQRGWVAREWQERLPAGLSGPQSAGECRILTPISSHFHLNMSLHGLFFAHTQSDNVA